MVSIVVPIYNVELYLEKCIVSILNQTYNDIELILINDGSTDRSLIICQKYEKIDERIVLINNENHGVSFSRNFGINIAKGEYICFIDSDDYISEDYIEKLLKGIEKTSSDLSICGYKCYGNSNLEVDLEDKEIDLFTDFEYMIDYLIKKKTLNTMCSKLFKRELISTKFDEKISNGEDLDFILSYLSSCKKVQIIDNCYYNYNIRSVSLSKNFKSNKTNATFFISLANKYLKLHDEFCNYPIKKNDSFFDYVSRNIRLMFYNITTFKISKTEKKEMVSDLLSSKELKKYINKYRPKSLKFVNFKSVNKTYNMLVVYAFFIKVGKSLFR